MKITLLIGALLLWAPGTWADVLRSSARLGLPPPPGQAVPESVCGDVDDSQRVEAYDGRLGVSKKFVRRHQSRVAQLQWLPDLKSRFAGTGDDPGNVAGVRWCTGTMISATDLLTAAHCLRVQAGGWKSPKRGGTAVPPAEIATLMQVNFNYQHKGDTNQLNNSVTFEVDSLVEFGDDRDAFEGEHLDYAIIRLRPKDGVAPSARYGLAIMDSSQEGRDLATRLAIIQHPEGRPKMVNAGEQIVAPRDILLRYGDLDTFGGSSGSGILDQDGELIGVHTNGGCTLSGGFNYGVSLYAIGKVSTLID